jgi:hypothetical protein
LRQHVELPSPDLLGNLNRNRVRSILSEIPKAAGSANFDISQDQQTHDIPQGQKLKIFRKVSDS